MKCFKLISINGGDSSFIEGSIPELSHIKAGYFFVHNHIEAFELSAHTAPRYQFVVTLKGKLKFTVTSGDTFVIEPGVMLIAKDLTGKGHTWKIVDGSEWLRIYIVPEGDADDHFQPLQS